MAWFSFSEDGRGKNCRRMTNLVYLLRWIPEDDRLRTGDGLEGFCTWPESVCLFWPTFIWARTSFTWSRLISVVARLVLTSSRTPGGRWRSVWGDVAMWRGMWGSWPAIIQWPGDKERITDLCGMSTLHTPSIITACSTAHPKCHYCMLYCTTKVLSLAGSRPQSQLFEIHDVIVLYICM